MSNKKVRYMSRLVMVMLLKLGNRKMSVCMRVNNYNNSNNLYY